MAKSSLFESIPLVIEVPHKRTYGLRRMRVKGGTGQEFQK